MKKLIFSILLLISVTICCGMTHKKITAIGAENSATMDTSFVPTDSKQLYFPLKDCLDSFKNTWYSKHLFALREPIIFMDKSKNEIYRFTWLRTFNNPVAIRIEKRDNQYLLFWKLSDGAGGYKPGRLSINKHKTIDKQIWDTFLNKLNEIGFWSLATNDDENLGFDGSQWILESKTPNQYHVVDRWTPNEKSKYYQTCNFLIDLTDLKIQGDDKY